MAKIHFESVYRLCDHVFSGPLCYPIASERSDPVSPRRDEITCSECLRFLMRLKESSNA